MSTLSPYPPRATSNSILRSLENIANTREERQRFPEDPLGHFRQRANRNDFRRGRYDDRERGGGERERREYQDRGPGRPRPDGSSGRSRPDETPLSSASVRDRSWDSTPGATRRSWDSTPRTEQRRSREWDTPSRRTGVDYPEERSPPPMDSLEYREWEEEQMRLDRDWYSYEDGVAADEEHNPFAAYEDREKEADLSKKGNRKVSARQAQYNADNDLWETNRLAQSGQGGRRVLDLDDLDEEESRVHLLVHDIRPPFLDGRVLFTKQIDPVNPVRDPTSDMAIFSKKGSALVKEIRSRREREKASAKVAALEGTTLGNLTGVKEEEDGEGTNKATHSNSRQSADRWWRRTRRYKCELDASRQQASKDRGRGRSSPSERIPIRVASQGVKRKQCIFSVKKLEGAEAVPARFCLPRRAVASRTREPRFSVDPPFL
jgi:pre-mRNA-splicing factor ATP-dependent RNA helicase DHX38/PRP16